MIVGQDRKFLGALIVPDFESLTEWARDAAVLPSEREGLVEDPRVRTLFNQEVSRLVNSQNGFRPFEQVSRFALIPSEFLIGEELSAKQEIKRHVIAEKYATEIAALFE